MFVLVLTLQGVKKSAAVAGHPACPIHSRCRARNVVVCSRCVSLQFRSAWLSMVSHAKHHYRVVAGSKRVTVPGTSTVLHPSQTVYSPILLLCVYLLLAHAAVQYLKAARQREADQADTALKPESIVGTSSEWQEAWPIDYGQGIPQGDASSLPVDRSMQQPRDHTLEHNTDALFDNIRDLKQRLYGTDANVTIRGKRDLATAAAEIDRCDCHCATICIRCSAPAQSFPGFWLDSVHVSLGCAACAATFVAMLWHL